MSPSRKTTKAARDLRAPVNAKQKCQRAARRRRLVKQRAAKAADRECVYIDACSGSGCEIWFVTCIFGDGGFLGGFLPTRRKALEEAHSLAAECGCEVRA